MADIVVTSAITLESILNSIHISEKADLLTLIRSPFDMKRLCVSYYGGIVPIKMGYRENKRSLIIKGQIIKLNRFLHSRLV